MDLSTLTPERIVGLLDKHVHGQVQAKEALALAIRNRWRRLQLPPEIRENVKKQNILLKGPTGSGKTALIRAIQKELGWPVHFVDITQYTETGYKGKDLDEIISNFVEAYEDKPLPKWYLEAKTAAPVIKAIKGDVCGDELKDYEHDKLVALVSRALWVTSMVEDNDVPNPKDNPVTDILGNRFFDALREAWDERDIDETALGLGIAVGAYRAACVLCPTLAEVDGALSAPELTALHSAAALIDGETLPSSDVLAALSADAGRKVINLLDYAAVAGPVLSRVSYNSVCDYFSEERLEELDDGRATNTYWWLWLSAMYDELVRQGAWREVANTNRISNKRLNPKARKVLSDIYGYSRRQMEGVPNLGDFYAYAMKDCALVDKKPIAPLKTTKNLVLAVLTRRLNSPKWDRPPHAYTATLASSPIVGAEIPNVSASELEKSHSRLRTFIRECTGKTISARTEPTKLWEEYIHIFDKLGDSLSALTPVQLGRYTQVSGRRPKAPPKERHWNEPNPSLRGLEEFVSAMSGTAERKSGDTDVIKFIQDYGICFLDEFDKLGTNDTSSMVSRDGVQRGLLALVEGADYPIKSKDRLSERIEYTFDTSNLMFVAAGAFSMSPLDAIIPELRGRFPVVASILPLTKENYVSILKLETSQVYYMSELIKVEGVAVNIDEGGYEAMAEVCGLMNATVNLGARRLDSVIERVFHEAMMSPDKFATTGFNVTKEYVYGLDWSATDLVIKFENPDDVKPEPEKAT